MTEVEKLLRNGKSARDEEVAPVLDEELREAEAALGVSFPASYREFIALGGLSELCIHHRVLRPSGIVEAKRYTGAAPLIPFADNGCGDLYGWTTEDANEPSVVLWGHEGGSVTEDAPSFVSWLARSRF